MPLNQFPINDQLINEELATPPGSSDAISFNGFGLQSSVVVTSEADEYSGPQRDLSIVDIPGGDGGRIDNDRLSQKVITLEGVVFGSTAAALDARIDDMKKNLFVKNGILKITQVGGEVRYYTATLISPQSLFARRTGRDVTRAPFEAKFVCVDPLAREASREVISYFSKTTSPFSFEIFNNGNFKTQPVIFLSFDAADTVTAVNITNSTTGEEIEISTAISAGQLLEINAEEKYVKLDGVEIDFDGFFFDLLAGANAITITVTSTSHSYNFTGKFFNRYT